MVFEYMEHGDLADLLRKNDPSLGGDRYFELKQVRVRGSATVYYILSEQIIMLPHGVLDLFNWMNQLN